MTNSPQFSFLGFPSGRAPRWDVGLDWRTDVIEAATELSVELAVVRDDHLKRPSATEDDFILRLIRVSTRMGERITRRAWMPQTRALVMSRFPYWQIELPWPPLIEIESITYVDSDGVTQTLDPETYQVSAPTGPTCRKGRVAPAVGEYWPITQSGALEAVTVTYRCGYLVAGSSPPEAAVPDDLVHAQLLVIGELFEQRSDSAVAFDSSSAPAFRAARAMWLDYQVPG